MTIKSKSIILSGLIFPIIVGILVEVFTSIDVFSVIWTFFSIIISFFAIRISLQLWIIILIFFFGLVIPILLIYLVGKKDSHLFYRDDSFYGFDWQWDYSGGSIVNLIPICPCCKYQPQMIRFYIGGYRAAGEGTRIDCDHCGKKREYEFPPDDLIDRVKREIHRKIRTKQYEDILSIGGS